MQARQAPPGGALAAGAPAADGDGRGWGKESPALIAGSSVEARAVCLALEQCLFHRIRVKEFGERY